MVYIYILIDPITDEIRYCGKTTRNLKVRLQGGYGRYTQNWINSIKKKGLNPQIIGIDCVEDEDWVEAEKLYIEHLRLLGYRLTNISDGGEGGAIRGHPVSKETRDKLAAFFKGRPNLKNRGRQRLDVLGENNPAKRPEVRAKIGDAHRGKTTSEDTRVKISNTLKEKGIMPPLIKGRPPWNKGKSLTEEHKEKLRKPKANKIK